MRATPRRRVIGAALAAAAVTVSGLGASARGGTPGAFGWLKPAEPPSSWKHASVPSGGAILSYPPSFGHVSHDRYSISVGRRDSSGRVAVYLNATPQQGTERLRGWPAFRLYHNRAESKSVHEEASASGLRFTAAAGSCVMDDYVTRGTAANHYREIACFIQGRTTSSVIVAAALESEWARWQTLLRRAVSAYLVN